MKLEPFLKRTLGLVMWSKVKEILDLVEAGERRILIRSCNGAGKTAVLAGICNWALTEWKDGIVLTTASSYSQVKRNLWGEIRSQARRAKLYEPEQIHDTLISLADKHYATGISPALPENAQGYHAERMLIVVDEATGVDRDIITSLMGNLTSAKAQIILAYNPINRDSFAYEAEMTGAWKVVTINAFECPNIDEPGTIPGAVTREWIDEMFAQWSRRVEQSAHSIEWNGAHWELTNIIRNRVLGEWADSMASGLFEEAEIVECFGRWEKIESDVAGRGKVMSLRGGLQPDEAIPFVHDTNLLGTTEGDCFVIPTGFPRNDTRDRPVLGVDICRGGEDQTCFTLLKDNTAQILETAHYNRLTDIYERILVYRNTYNCIVCLDDTGVGGGVTDMLLRVLPAQEVIPINFAASARNIFRSAICPPANARAEMYLHLCKLIKEAKAAIKADRQLLQELLAVGLTYDGSGKSLITPKDDIKKKLGRSPDRADSLALAFYGKALYRPDRFRLR